MVAVPGRELPDPDAIAITDADVYLLLYSNSNAVANDNPDSVAVAQRNAQRDAVTIADAQRDAITVAVA